jgi:hypothetical protein
MAKIAKSNRKPRTRQDARRELTERPTFAIKQMNGSDLIFEVDKDGTRRAIGRAVRF